MKIEIEELKYTKKIVLKSDDESFRLNLTDMLSSFEKDIILKAYLDCKLYVSYEQRIYMNVPYEVIYISIYGAKLVLKILTKWKERALEILKNEEANNVDLGVNPNEKDIEVI